MAFPAATSFVSRRSFSSIHPIEKSAAISGGFSRPSRTKIGTALTHNALASAL